MKLVILGAGASFDSMYEFNDNHLHQVWRPPLANELFDSRPKFRNIIQSYPGSKALLSQINTVNDIEEYFQSKWDFANKHNSKELFSTLINIQYFLQHLLYTISVEYRYVGMSNYDYLLQSAYEYSISKKEEICFVSFNYDLFLEFSFRNIFSNPLKDPLTIEEYIKYPLKLIKPHGSCNWFKTFKINSIGMQNEELPDYLYNNKISWESINERLEENFIAAPYNLQHINNNGIVQYLFPQIMIPYKNKDGFILPKTHLDILQSCMSKITGILIIGWKGAEIKFKNLLLEYLGNNKIKITVVNAMDKTVEENLKIVLPKAEFYHFEEEFSMNKYDNTTINDPRRIDIAHKKGTFSSYILHCSKNQENYFFRN